MATPVLPDAVLYVIDRFALAIAQRAKMSEPYRAASDEFVTKARRALHNEIARFYSDEQAPPQT